MTAAVVLDQAAAAAVVMDACPARRHGITSALAEAGCAVEAPDDLAGWLRANPRRVAVVAVRDEHDLAQLGTICGGPGGPNVVAIVTRASATTCTAALRAGATAVVQENGELHELVAVVSAAAMGFSIVPRDVVHVLAGSADVVAIDVSVGEKEVALLRALAAGSSVADIAAESAYSIRSTYRHLARLYRRLGASNRMEALLAAARLGIVR